MKVWFNRGTLHIEYNDKKDCFRPDGPPKSPHKVYRNDVWQKITTFCQVKTSLNQLSFQYGMFWVMLYYHPNRDYHIFDVEMSLPYETGDTMGESYNVTEMEDIVDLQYAISTFTGLKMWCVYMNSEFGK
jgi:hypothetical protein